MGSLLSCASNKGEEEVEKITEKKGEKNNYKSPPCEVPNDSGDRPTKKEGESRDNEHCNRPENRHRRNIPAGSRTKKKHSLPGSGAEGDDAVEGGEVYPQRASVSLRTKRGSSYSSHDHYDDGVSASTALSLARPPSAPTRAAVHKGNKKAKNKRKAKNDRNAKRAGGGQGRNLSPDGSFCDLRRSSVSSTTDHSALFVKTPSDTEVTDSCLQKAQARDGYFEINDLHAPDDGLNSSNIELSSHFTVGVPVSGWNTEKIMALKNKFKDKYLAQLDESTPVPRLLFLVEKSNLNLVSTQLIKYFQQNKMPDGKHRDGEIDEADSLTHKRQSINDTNEERELDCEDVEALQILMGNEFTDNVSLKKDGNETRMIFKGHGAKGLLKKVDMLRHEDIVVSENDLCSLGKAFASTEEDLEACFIPNQKHGKVSIYTFDYNAMYKAKHLLGVKMGKVKVTTRGRRKFKDRSDESTDESSNPSANYDRSRTQQQQKVDVSTKYGIKLSSLFNIDVPVSGWSTEKIMALKNKFEDKYIVKHDKSTPVPRLRFFAKKKKLPLLSKELFNYFQQNEMSEVNHKYGERQEANSLTHKSQSINDRIEERELDRADVEALQILMGTEFTDKVSLKEDGNKTRIICKGHGAKELLEKVDMLRREDFVTSETSLSRLGKAFASTEEDLEACFIPQHSQGKVLVYTFDYNAMSKAKHFLHVKMGNVKVTKRRRRKFENRSEEGTDELLHLLASSERKRARQQRLDVKTKSGIEVSVYKSDLTKLPVNAIVNAANENLLHGGGVALAISKAAGNFLEEESYEYVRKHGPLKVSEVVVTTAGNLPCQKVLHAVGPRWSDYEDKTQCENLIADTIYNCLCTAGKIDLSSLALPAISSAIFGVPKEICSRSYLVGIKRFDRAHGGLTSVEHIHFVDINDEIIAEIQQTFERDWDSELLPSQRDGEFAQDHEQTTKTLRNSSGAKTGKILNPRRESYTEEEKYNPPRLGSTSMTKDVQHVFKYKDVTLLCGCQDPALLSTEAIVSWQMLDTHGNDTLSHYFQDYLKQDSAFADKFYQFTSSDKTGFVDLIGAVEVNSALLVFPVIRPQPLLTADQVQHMVQASLNKVQMANKKSVAVMMNPQKEFNQSEKALNDFAKGFCRAFRNYAVMPQHSVDEVYVVGLELSVVEIVAKKMSGEMKQEEQMIKRPVDEGPCSICQEPVREPKQSLSCAHTFCKECIDPWLKEKQVCPNCNIPQGILYGNQPLGTMEMCYINDQIPGFQGNGAFRITYMFPEGKQNDSHPSPGRHYSGTSRTAYLPNVTEGRTVLMLLKTAFHRQLLFTIGESATNHGYVGIIWNGIHHKTSVSGGSHNYGYPDDSYLLRVKSELECKGVTEADLTDTQKRFIKDETSFVQQEFQDFSQCFQHSSSPSTEV